MNWEAVGEAVIRMEEAAELLHKLRDPIRRLEEHGGGAADMYHADSWNEVEASTKVLGDALEETADKLRRAPLEDNPA